MINSAKAAQDDEKDIIIHKLRSIKNPLVFIYKKIYAFAGYDSGVVEHLRDCNAFNNKRQIIGLSLMTNSFYYMLLMTSLVGVIIYYKNKNCDNNRNILLIILYGLGLMCVHLIAEVQPRYHYSLIPILIFLSSYCFAKIKSKMLTCYYRKTS